MARIQHALEGSVKFADCFIMHKILNQFKPKKCLEIGSFIGFSTRWMLECSSKWNMHITAIDPNMRHRIFDNPRCIVEFLNSIYLNDRLEIITGFFGAHGLWTPDYTIFEPKRSQEWVTQLLSDRKEIDGNWDRTFDCIYIDADHSYESVMDGFQHALKLLNPGGMILFHDALTWQGVNQALKDIAEEFKGKARVEIIDGSDVLNHPALDQEPIKVTDGIGFFRLLN